MNEYNMGRLGESALLYDWKEHIIITPPPFNPPSSGNTCAFDVEATASFDSGQNKVTLSVEAFDFGDLSSGPIECKNIEYTIDWNDGTTPIESSSSSFTHTYTTEHLTSIVEDGECGDLLISVTAKLLPGINCGNCTGFEVADGGARFQFCNNAKCRRGGGNEESEEFVEDGLEFRVTGEIGQRTASEFLDILRPMVWTKASYAEFIRGEYRNRRPPRGMRLHAAVTGSHFTGSCTDGRDLGAENDGRRRSVTARGLTNREGFTTKDDDPAEPVGAVRIESGQDNYGITGIELYPN